MKFILTETATTPDQYNELLNLSTFPACITQYRKLIYSENPKNKKFFGRIFPKKKL